MKTIARTLTRTFAQAVTFAVLAASHPALAADAVFPPGSRVGLVPAEGLVVAKEFLGFESEDQKTKVGVAEIPAAAFEAVETALKEGKSAGPGSKPEPFETAAGKGYITSDTGKDGAVTVRMYSVIAPSTDKFTGYVIVQVRDDLMAATRYAVMKLPGHRLARYSAQTRCDSCRRSSRCSLRWPG